MNKYLTRYTKTTYLGAALIAGIVLMTIAVVATRAPGQLLITTVGNPAPITPAPIIEAQRSTTIDLAYLIEEEKLAHDVYITLSEKWGAKTFANISRSETNHQNQLVTLLSTKAISDPRMDEVGMFRNSDLQALYTKLVSDGSRSLADAYAVGVTIEKLDISDIDQLIASSANDSAVIPTLESLKRGSQNHLRAFTRQLNNLS